MAGVAPAALAGVLFLALTFGQQYMVGLSFEDLNGNNDLNLNPDSTNSGEFWVRGVGWGGVGWGGAKLGGSWVGRGQGGADGVG